MAKGSGGGKANGRGPRKPEAKARPFDVDDILIMRSTYTNQDMRVSYRGKQGDKAFVYDRKTGWQGAVPFEWLRRQ